MPDESGNNNSKDLDPVRVLKVKRRITDYVFKADSKEILKIAEHLGINTKI